ncbi:MAG TPA: hypothetical protein VHJ78_07645 [Actinomycetota bacterium]|nr:hypothetical protein [Actinomycetota bacterium]
MRTVIFVLFGVLVVLAVMATFKTMARASKGYDKAKQRRIESGPQTPCPVCRSSMGLVGVQEFRLSDNATGIDKDVAQALGAMGTDLPLEVYRCPTCRNIQLFLPPSAG